MAENDGDENDVLKSVGELIATAKSPMALHIQRESDPEPILALLQTTLERERKSIPAKAAKPYNNNNNNKIKKKPTKTAPRKAAIPKKTKVDPIIHPLATVMSQRSLIQKGKEELVVTRQLRIFTDRTRQWESKLSFRLRSGDYTLRPLLDARDVEPSYYASFLMDDG